MYRNIYRLGLVMYAILLILAVVYYKERIVIMDDALYLFNILREGTFSIQHFRFIAVVTEIFPLLASKLSLPLDMVIMAYSAGFIIYYMGCYILCGLMKQYRMGIILLLVNILFCTHTFYWMLSELTQGLALMCVFFAFAISRNSNNNKAITALAIIAIIPTLAFAHPLLTPCFVYGLFYMVVDVERPLSKKYAAALLSLYALTLIIKAVFFKEPYEAHSMGGIGNFVKLFPNYFNIHSNRVFIKNCLLKYQWIPACFFIISVIYFRSKQWLKLMAFTMAVVGYVALINISYPSEYTFEFYIENLYLPLGFLLGLPFVTDVIPVLHQRKWAVATVSLICLTALIRIPLQGRFYTQRLNWQRDYIQANENKKLIVDFNMLPKSKLLMAFGSPYEIWLLSTTELGKTASMIFSENISEIEWAYNTRNEFVTTWGLFPYDTLDSRYFMFNDTVSKYIIVK